MDRLPTDMLAEIVEQVASFSLKDLLRLCACSRELSEIGSSSWSMRRLPFDSVKQLMSGWGTPDAIGRRMELFDACIQSGNTDALFCLGLVQWIGQNNIEGLDLIHQVVALDGSHVCSIYALAIAQLFGDEEEKETGIKIITAMRRNKVQNTEMKNARKRMLTMLPRGWSENRYFFEHVPQCCAIPNHLNLHGWHIDEETVECDRCYVDLHMMVLQRRILSDPNGFVLDD